MKDCGFSLSYCYRIFRSIAAWALALRCCSIAARALSLCSRSSREGFSFLLHEQKKRNKENSPSALFCLLRHFSPLNKKNSLRSNSFLFFTLRKAPALHGKKVRTDLSAFSQHRFARWGGCFLFLLRSFYFVIQSGAKDLENIKYRNG